MNSGLVHSELNFNWRLFAKTVSKSPNWGFDRFRIYGNSWSTRIQVRRPDGSVVGTQYFSSNYQFEHDFSFDLSENVNNDEYSVYIAGVPATATVEQVYAYPTGYGGTTGKNAEISYWDLAQVSPEANGSNIGRLRLENNPLSQLDGTANIKAKEIRLTNCQLGGENLADLTIAIDNTGLTNGTFIYSGNSAAPAGRALDAYNNLKNNKAWAITGEVPVDAAQYDPDYQAVLNYATANSIAIPSSSQRIIDNQKVLDLKANNLWVKLKSLIVLNTTANNQFTRIDWKRLVIINDFGSLTQSSLGKRGNGTNGYISSGINLSTDFPQITKTNFAMGYRLFDFVDGAAGAITAVRNSNTIDQIYLTRTGTTDFLARILNNSVAFTLNNVTAAMMNQPHYGELSGGTYTFKINNIVKINTAVSAGNFPNKILPLLAADADTGISSYADFGLSWFYISEPLSNGNSIIESILG